MVVNPEDRSSRIETQTISMRQFHFPQIDFFLLNNMSSDLCLNVTSIVGHVLFISLRIYKFCLFQLSPRLFGSPNVHSTLRSMNREWFSRRSSTVGPGFITMFKAKDLTLCPSTRELIKCSKNLDEAYCILKVTGVQFEKTLMYIFSKIQLFEVQP